MKEEKRHISTEKKLIIGIVIAILVFICSVYIYNNHLVGRSFADNILLFIVGILVILITFASFLAACSLIGIFLLFLIDNYHEKKSYLRSKEQIKALPSDFVNVRFKNFDNFPLSDFVSNEDITCFAKLDEDGNVVYAIQLNVEYETDDYELFLKHFEF